MGITVFKREFRFLRNRAVMKQFSSRLFVIVAVTGLVVAGWQSISEARDLFQLVDRDAVACLHARQLDAHGETLRKSEFGSRLKQAPFFQEWVESPDYNQLKVVQAVVEAASGKPLGQSLHELLGEDVVIAWYHTPGSKPDLARNSVVLLKVESRAAAESALATWNVLEKQTKVTRKHRDVVYTHSVKAGADQKAGGVWYTILDSVLAISAREDRIQRVIDFAAEAVDESPTPAVTVSAGHPDCLSAYEPFAKAYARRPDSEFAAAYINPRVLGSELGRASKDFSAVESALTRCQWMTFRLTFDESVELEFVADYDSEGSPEWWQQWLEIAGADQPSSTSIPSNALFAMSGRVASLSISGMILKSLPRQSDLPQDLIKARRVLQGLLLGLDPVADVLPAIGPSWVFSVEPRDPEVSTSFPVDSLFAIELQPQTRDGDEVVDAESVSTQDALDNSLNVGLGLLAAVHNAHATGQPVSVVRRREVDGVMIRYADPVSFFQPAYAIANGHLVLATSPDLCETFLKTAGVDRAAVNSPDANSDRVRVKSHRPGNLQNVVASSVATRRMLAQHSDWFIQQARRDHVPEAEAKQRLEQLDQFLQLLDRAWLTANIDESTFRVSAGIAAQSSKAE
jgi:hypothetical protein